MTGLINTRESTASLAVNEGDIEANKVRPAGPQASMINEIVVRSGAVLQGHFKLASGRHSDTYIEKFRILEQPQYLAEVAEAIVSHFSAEKPEIIVGPSTGGMIVAYEVARQLKLHAVYVELVDGKRTLRRGGHIEVGARVLLVDDVLTTGTSLLEVIPVVKSARANLIGVGVLIDRSEKPVDFGAELFASAKFSAQSFPEDAIPQWLADIPLTTPGTRAQLH